MATSAPAAEQPSLFCVGPMTVIVADVTAHKTPKTPTTPFPFNELLDTCSRLSNWSNDQIREKLQMSGFDLDRLSGSWIDDLHADTYAGRLDMHPSEIWVDWGLVAEGEAEPLDLFELAVAS